MSHNIAQTAKGPIEYRLEGNGPTVMVLNGGHCSRETRLSHEKLTERGFSVLTPSRPGYDSTPSEVGKTAQAAADALAALLGTLQIATVDVIGISAAGPTALAFVQQFPSRVRKLILESAVTTDWDQRTKRRSRIGFGRAAKVSYPTLKLLGFLGRASTDKLVAPSIWRPPQALQLSCFRSSRPGLFTYIASLPHREAFSQLQKVTLTLK